MAVTGKKSNRIKLMAGVVTAAGSMALAGLVCSAVANADPVVKFGSDPVGTTGAQSSGDSVPATPVTPPASTWPGGAWAGDTGTTGWPGGARAAGESGGAWADHDWSTGWPGGWLNNPENNKEPRGGGAGGGGAAANGKAGGAWNHE